MNPHQNLTISVGMMRMILLLTPLTLSKK